MRTAIATLTELSREYPELPEPYNNLAVIYAALGTVNMAQIADRMTELPQETQDTTGEMRRVGLENVRRRLDAGEIGTPLTALVLMQGPGPESWHPNPAFLFQEGAGPLFDIGPYYLTALVQLLGPVESVAAT